MNKINTTNIESNGNKHHNINMSQIKNIDKFNRMMQAKCPDVLAKIHYRNKKNVSRMIH